MTLHPRLKDIIQSPKFSTTDVKNLEDRLGDMLPLDIGSAANIGISIVDNSATPLVFATDPSKNIGNINISSKFSSSILYFDNRDSEGQLFGSIRLHGENSQCIFEDAGKNYVGLHVLNMRSHMQNFFFGKGSTAVGLSVELEGEGATCVVGDDALISSGVWLRNHDMHSVVDLGSAKVVNTVHGDMLLERHVWLGQDVLAVGAQHIGFGAIIGAKSFLKRPVPPKCIAAGAPARIIRENMSWGRQTGRISETELSLLEELSAMT